MQVVHPLREVLHNEVHARPHERMKAPLMLTHVGWAGAELGAARAHLNRLLESRHLPLAGELASHLSTAMGRLTLRWEGHGEFHTATFWRELDAECDDFDDGVLEDVPRDWLEATPGQWLVGLHLIVLRRDSLADPACLPQQVQDCLAESSLVGSRVMDGQAELYTDFQLYADGFARWVLVVDNMNPRRLGRTVQRALEIETYRMMALLGLPAAREVGSALVRTERDLSEVADAIRSADSTEEPELLRRLTALAAQVEGLFARTHTRFAASRAYFKLVQRRIEELREERLVGLQSLGEFMERRLAPGMQTCDAAARRLQALSERISRTSNLLRTRVEVEQQRSSQALLDAMNRRQEAQLLLQSAVEGLSVAAITYYGAGLLGYLAKGAKEAGVHLAPEVVVALGVPVIAVAVWLGIRRLHAKVLASLH